MSETSKPQNTNFNQIQTSAIGLNANYATSIDLTGRAKWLWENYALKVRKSLKEFEQIDLSTELTFETLLSSDPSSNKSAVQWIADAYLRQGFLWEDLSGGKTSKVWETLVWFAKYKNNLPVENRNLYNYRNLADLYQAIELFLIQDEQSDLKNTKSKRDLKRIERQMADEQSYTLYKDDHLTLIIPLTEFASKFWGRGTRWCTAADKNNMFGRYNVDAPLIVCLLKKDNCSRKLQLWFKENNIQFMDETDKPVKINLIEEYWQQLEPILTLAFKTNAKVINFFPLNKITREICLKALESHEIGISHIPEQFLDYKMYLRIVENMGFVNFVPLALRDQQMYMAAIKKQGRSITTVPTELITEQMCMLSIKNNPNWLENIPERFLTKNLWLERIKINYRCIDTTPKEFIGYETSLALCYGKNDKSIKTKNDDRFFQSIPKEHYTKELLLAAVKKSGAIVGQIPLELLDHEICWAAIKDTPLAWLKIDEQFQTRELLLEAVRINGFLIKYLNLSELDQEICKLAVTSRPNVIEYIPAEFVNEDLMMIALDKNFDLEYDLSTDAQRLKVYINTPKLVEKVIERALENPQFLQLIDIKYYSPELLSKFIDINPWTLNRIPEEFHTQELREQAVKKDGSLLVWIKECYQTPTMIKNAIRSFGLAILEIDENLRTYDLYKLALEQNPKIWDVMPKEFRTDETDWIVNRGCTKTTQKYWDLQEFAQKFQTVLSDQQTNDLKQRTF